MSLETIRERYAAAKAPSVMLTNIERSLLVAAVSELECPAADWIRDIASKYQHVDTYVQRAQLGELLEALAPSAAESITDEPCPAASPTTLEEPGRSLSPFPRLAELDRDAE